MPTSFKINNHVLKLSLIFVLVFLAYSNSLKGPFVFDDYHTIVDNPAFKVDNLSFSALKQSLTSSITGISSRPVALFTLLLNYHFFGLETSSFKFVNLIIHLSNSILLYILLLKIFSTLKENGEILNFSVSNAAFIMAAIWAMHPLNLTSVLYVIQRMASLATTFMFLFLWTYVSMRQKQIKVESGAWWYTIGLLITFILGVLTKENAVVVLGIIFLFEIMLFKQNGKLLIVKKIMALGIQCGWISVALLFMCIVWKWQWFQDSYQLRNYTLEERLLTETRVLWFYVKLIIIPDITKMALFHDDFQISSSVFEPITTFFSILSWVSIAIFSWIFRKRAPLLILGLSWYWIGHSIESTFISLEIIHEHRNYFPMIGILISVLGLGNLIKPRLKNANLNLYKYLACVSLIFLFSATWSRAQSWQSKEKLVQSEVIKNSDSARAQYDAGRTYFFALSHEVSPSINSSNYTNARTHLEKTFQVNHENVLGLLTLIRLNELIGLQPEKKWVMELLKRLEQYKIDSQDMHAVHDFLVCNIEGFCKTDFQLMNKIVMAIDKNKEMIPSYHAYILSMVSAYLVEKGYLDHAIYYLAKAESIDLNNHNHKMSLSTLLIKANRYTDAKEYLLKVNRNFLNDEMKKSYDNISILMIDHIVNKVAQSILVENNLSN
jgi:tetratricopeptide (TPR) repeat protein